MTSEQRYAGLSVKKAWRVSRKFSKKKNADGQITQTWAPGPSLKAWARKQIADNTVEAPACKLWFKGKAAAR